MRQWCLPRNTETCLSILRLSLDSWRRNKSSYGLGSWFWVLVGPVRKTRQTYPDIFYNLSQKMWFFSNNTKHRQIIYQIKAREEMSSYISFLSLADDRSERNGCLSHSFTASFALATFDDSTSVERAGSWPSASKESKGARYALKGGQSLAKLAASTFWAHGSPWEAYNVDNRGWDSTGLRVDISGPSESCPRARASNGAANSGDLFKPCIDEGGGEGNSRMRREREREEEIEGD